MGIGYALGLLGKVALHQGDHERAEKLFTEVLGLCRQGGYPTGVAGTLCNLGLCAALRGDDDRAVAWYEESLALSRELGETAGIATVLGNLAWVLHRRGDTRRAAALNREALAAAWDRRDQPVLAVLFDDAAVAAVRVGDSARAARLLGAAARLREGAGTPVAIMNQADYVCDLAAVRANLDESAFQTAWAEGKALALAEAVAEAEAAFAEEEGWLPEGALPPRASDPVALSGLSPRELEVVRLIAAGSSNQDIADALFISHRTATTHVRNILTKLNLDNRAAVAAWATRHHLA